MQIADGWIQTQVLRCCNCATTFAHTTATTKHGVLFNSWANLKVAYLFPLKSSSMHDAKKVVPYFSVKMLSKVNCTPTPLSIMR